MGFMDIIRKIGNPFKGLLQLPKIVKRVEPEEFVYGYDLYTAMPDGLLGARIPDEDNWFDESIYAVPWRATRRENNTPKDVRIVFQKS